ncbi:MAG: bifunctional salicylyl-CoA 5-hydroxylase/oxidoreductase [Burkholderiaceae bacterium]|jgi:anthraniloyl-CoA monooxygenase|nr:bifunctional salicylyl-CoA 5-hydroxylase/oxidoreductase [Burkholderiaceae bacterium]
MRIDVIGGGAAGLYSAILLKKSFPTANIQVVERNRPDDTFGFGIVLSDETLGNLRDADEPTHREIAANFAYWDDIYVQYKGQVLKSSGHGFSGIRRLTLLQILQRRADELGIEVRYETEDPGVHAHLGADLVVAADGINSAVREGWKDHFAPSVDLRTNRFVWLGAKMDLPGFYYSFREGVGGIWNMHAYQYTPGESTIVIETTNEAFLASGLGIQDEAATVKLVEKIFADDLNGARVLANRSFWRQFPTITCRTWRHRDGETPFVLLGDAAHTAHFTIGSGTKLALEDAIALNKAMVEHVRAGAGAARAAQVDAALAAYEEARRDEVGRIQHSANVSLVWFENVRRFWHMAPTQFHVSLLTRSKQITYENLRLRDAGVVEEATEWWNRDQAKRLGIATAGRPAWIDAPPMFAPFRLREMWVPNRVAVSPMAQYSAVDGVPGDWHLVHYGSRALGGAGLVFVEMTCVSPEGRITPGCTGLWNDEQAQAFARIVDFVHANTQSKICMQIGHAGRKGSTQVGWEEADWPIDESSGQRNWPLLSPSPLPYRDGVNQVPREMTREDMDEVIEQFCRSAILADRAGFDMLELHMAHGYLLASFLSPITNCRRDAYGGSLANRLRFPLEMFEAVRAVWPRAKPMSVRVSATDWIPGGTTGADTVEVARAMKAAGCDLIDVSTGQTDPASKPVYGRMYQATFSEQVRLEAGIATMAVGAITSADQVNTLLISGRADLVALARPHLADPYFTLHAAADYDFRGVGWPVQYHTGATQLYTTVRRAREEAARKAQMLAERGH